MGTTAEKLAYLADTKTTIKDAIISKGTDVPEGTTFRQYADLISGISTGLSDADLALATATEDTVFNGRTFYARDKTMRTGRALATPATVDTSKMFTGVTAYNQQGQLITGAPTATTFDASNLFNGKEAYDNNGNLITGEALSTPITAVESDVKSGKTYYDNNGVLHSGGLTAYEVISGSRAISSGTGSGTINIGRTIKYAMFRLNLRGTFAKPCCVYADGYSYASSKFIHVSVLGTTLNYSVNNNEGSAFEYYCFVT